MTIFNGTFKNTADFKDNSKSSNEYKYVMTLKSAFDRIISKRVRQLDCTGAVQMDK